MSFKITITRIDTKKTVEMGVHTVIKEVPWTREDFRDERSSYQTPEEFLKTNPMHRVYGYAPSFETTKDVETKVLEQTVDALDLASVIRAVNGL